MLDCKHGEAMMKNTRCESINVVAVMLWHSGSSVIGVQPSSKPVVADIKCLLANLGLRLVFLDADSSAARATVKDLSFMQNITFPACWNVLVPN